MSPGNVLGVGNDGVGTKLQVAMMAHRFEGVGRDLIVHMANDLLCHGIRPSCLVDYFATVNLKEMTGAFVGTLTGMCKACLELGIAVVAGETAEMPGTYVPGQYDFVGTMLGWTDKESLITGKDIQPGDIVLGLASEGLGTNGYSLAREAIFQDAKLSIDSQLPWDVSVADELLRPHHCYLPTILPFLPHGVFLGIAHITGGGIPSNLVRILPEGCMAVLDRTKWKVPPIFPYIRNVKGQPEKDHFRTFNIGLGLTVVVKAHNAKDVLTQINQAGCVAWQVGNIVEGKRDVVIN
jgi:phosphoribosylformylglycinamidine cyclo-ligase